MPACAAENVTAADHQSDFDALTGVLVNFASDAADHHRIDAVVAGPHQGFPAQFQQDTTVGEFRAFHNIIFQSVTMFL
jgi:hypothetical protein